MNALANITSLLQSSKVQCVNNAPITNNDINKTIEKTKTKIMTTTTANIKNDDHDEYLDQQQYNNRKNDDHDEYLFHRWNNSKSNNKKNNVDCFPLQDMQLVQVPDIINTKEEQQQRM